MNFVFENVMCKVKHIFLVSTGMALTPLRLCDTSGMLLYIQVSLIITLSLGSMETDRVISEPCYNEVIYNTRHIAK